MIILSSLIVFYLFVLMVGKYARNINYLGYFFVGVLTVLQVGVLLYFLFTMEVPQP